MVTIRDADLARYAAAERSAMTDTCTNSRTSVTTPCRVVDGKLDLRLPIPGLSESARVRAKIVKQPLEAVVRSGDVLTVTGTNAGVYEAIMKLSGATLSVTTETRCVEQDPNGDGSHLPIPGNAQVTIRLPQKPVYNGAPNEVTVSAWLFHPTQADVELYGLEPGIKWGVVIGRNVTLPDGSPIIDNLEIREGDVLGRKSDGSARKTTLSHTVRSFGPLGVTVAFFTEPS